MTEPIPMTGDTHAGTQVGVSQETATENGDGAVGGGEPVSVGHDGSGFGELLSGEPSDTVPVAAGTYSLYRATDGSVVLVLEDSRMGLKTLRVPRAMIAMMGSGGRPKINPFSLFGGKRG